MKKVVIDIVPVLIGILLALFISNWQQSASDQSYIENSIRAIIQENESNIRELVNSLHRQRGFLDTLNKYANDQSSLYEINQMAGGLNTPDLKSTTWKFLIQDSKHTLVDYEFINRLAEIEKYEVLVDQHNQNVLELIYQPAYFNDPDLVKVCNLMLQDMRQVEQLLKSALEDFNFFAREKGF
ncbi:MAG: hypothetical protein ABJG78_19865 [Cyclobacteriaceae bacterium]